ncbi:uncharacterized protein LOC116951372 isoform X1 [Petromyzon marinus]|uniref:Protein argonaute-2-like isoform X1 n=1 Tax=Petromyzon marinus TaxID=7757 RepID=A0AAJ7TZD1_PETMA|nr:protein argonaute-2-like isoform X1 [Petromyzon marinus]
MAPVLLGVGGAQFEPWVTVVALLGALASLGVVLFACIDCLRDDDGNSDRITLRAPKLQRPAKNGTVHQSQQPQQQQQQDRQRQQQQQDRQRQQQQQQDRQQQQQERQQQQQLDRQQQQQQPHRGDGSASQRGTAPGNKKQSSMLVRQSPPSAALPMPSANSATGQPSVGAADEQLYEQVAEESVYDAVTEEGAPGDGGVGAPGNKKQSSTLVRQSPPSAALPMPSANSATGQPSVGAADEQLYEQVAEYSVYDAVTEEGAPGDGGVGGGVGGDVGGGIGGGGGGGVGGVGGGGVGGVGGGGGSRKKGGGGYESGVGTPNGKSKEATGGTASDFLHRFTVRAGCSDSQEGKAGGPGEESTKPQGEQEDSGTPGEEVTDEVNYRTVEQDPFLTPEEIEAMYTKVRTMSQRCKDNGGGGGGPASPPLRRSPGNRDKDYADACEFRTSGGDGDGGAGVGGDGGGHGSTDESHAEAPADFATKI